MATTNIHEAKTHFSRLLARVAAGETVVIAKAGKPVARLAPMEAPATKPRRIGFLAGQVRVPDDFDSMAAAEIESLFGGKP